jgi:hypothetical protein
MLVFCRVIDVIANIITARPLPHVGHLRQQMAIRW